MMDIDNDNNIDNLNFQNLNINQKKCYFCKIDINDNNICNLCKNKINFLYQANSLKCIYCDFFIDYENANICINCKK